MTHKPNNISTTEAGQRRRLPPVRVKLRRADAYVALSCIPLMVRPKIGGNGSTKLLRHCVERFCERLFAPNSGCGSFAFRHNFGDRP